MSWVRPFLADHLRSHPFKRKEVHYEEETKEGDRSYSQVRMVIHYLRLPPALDPGGSAVLADRHTGGIMEETKRHMAYVQWRRGMFYWRCTCGDLGSNKPSRRQANTGAEAHMKEMNKE